jgi:GNAT superfamily N-acetyltransferase
MSPGEPPVEIVPYRPAWAAQLCQLSTELWSSDPARNRRYLQWKYRDNPVAARLWVARVGGELVGMRGAVGLRWQSRQTRALCLSPADAMVHASQRRRGIFRALTQALVAADRDQPHVNLSSYRTSSAGYQQLGWRVVGSWQAAHRQLRFRRQDSLAPGDATGAPTPFAVLDLYAPTTLPAQIALERRPRGAAMAALVARLADRQRLRPLRDRRFYEWRYRNPLRDYRFVFVGDKRLRAFAVLQFDPRFGAAHVNVIEWEGESAVDKALALEAAMTWGDFAALTVWASSFADEEQQILARLGFGQLDHASAEAHGFYCPEILVRPGRSSLSRALGDPRRWQLPGSASDQF